MDTTIRGFSFLGSSGDFAADRRLSLQERKGFGAGLPFPLNKIGPETVSCKEHHTPQCS